MGVPKTFSSSSDFTATIEIPKKIEIEIVTAHQEDRHKYRFLFFIPSLGRIRGFNSLSAGKEWIRENYKDHEFSYKIDGCTMYKAWNV